jgi:hypothetical protein
MVPVKQAPKYYVIELSAAMLLFMGAMYFRHGYALAHPGVSLLKSLVLMSPILPCLLAAAAIIRFYRHMDEMQQRQMLEQIGIAALVCALGSIFLGFSHDLGLPAIGIMWAWPLMGAGWLAVTLWRGYACAAQENGGAATARTSALLIAVVALPTLAYRFAAPLLGWSTRPFWMVAIATVMILAIAAWAAFRREPK